MVKYFVSYRGTYEIKDEFRDTYEERDIFASDVIESPKVTDTKSLEMLEYNIETKWDFNGVNVLFFKELYDE